MDGTRVLKSDTHQHNLIAFLALVCIAVNFQFISVKIQKSWLVNMQHVTPMTLESSQSWDEPFSFSNFY